MTPVRHADAVRSPLSFAGAGSTPERLARLHAAFAPVLNATRVFVHNQGSEHFISGDPAATLNFPSHDARSGSPRYRWEDRGDGVRYGYLEPGG